ncbi:MAG: SH3 domain-containing protein, partial [Clostridia bacterium]|nr:SH3 domain-containing protein [Clostridia bacterium]
MMVVWQPLVSVKEEPKEYIQQTDEMLYGDTCEILEEAGEYVKIRSDYGYEGYVLREALTELTVEPNAMVSVPFGDFLPQAMNW